MLQAQKGTPFGPSLPFGPAIGRTPTWVDRAAENRTETRDLHVQCTHLNSNFQTTMTMTTIRQKCSIQSIINFIFLNLNVSKYGALLWY